MAQLKFHARATVSGDNATVQRLHDAFVTLQEAVVAAGGECNATPDLVLDAEAEPPASSDTGEGDLA